MEYCSGGDLSKFIRYRKRLPEIIVKKFLRQLGIIYTERTTSLSLDYIVIFQIPFHFVSHQQ